ncbi:unnamed protein product [Haemonchus placei]|uniref:Uncharacterized protein n=1 Tax=Haemonchus placei TaxID=6290 RepID=A0A0N4WUJ0_HAEPC|nr:unnamed protein product [Haemonchus placei]
MTERKCVDDETREQFVAQKFHNHCIEYPCKTLANIVRPRFRV